MDSELSGSQQAGDRAARNTAIRAVAEVIGKLATLALFVVLAREVGQTGTGVYVLAFSFCQIAMMPVDLGFDRYLLRRVAEDRTELDRLFWNVIGVKLALAVPVLGATFLLVNLLGYDEAVRQSVYVFGLGFLFDALGRTITYVFVAHERGSALGLTVIAQRVVAAALGLAALLAGYGVVTVAAGYTLGSLVGLVTAAVLFVRHHGRLELNLVPSSWRGLTRVSFPFGVEDVFTVLLFKVDAVILSLMATNAAVGRYGAAYRLFESTLFITYSLTGAFAAMFTYLGTETEPSIKDVYQRSIKIAVVLLLPIGVTFAVLAEPICELFFGADFAAAGDPLRLLAPAVVLLAIVNLSSNLIVARRDPKIVMAAAGLMLVLNVALNVALIPAFDDSGAAAAMLVTEVVFVIIVMTIAIRTIGEAPNWVSMLGAPVAAGIVMAAVEIPLHGRLGLALGAGVVAYWASLAVLERTFSPDDLQFVRDMARRRFARP